VINGIEAMQLVTDRARELVIRTIYLPFDHRTSRRAHLGGSQCTLRREHPVHTAFAFRGGAAREVTIRPEYDRCDRCCGSADGGEGPRRVLRRRAERLFDSLG
jgi:hypothetical protein